MSSIHADRLLKFLVGIEPMMVVFWLGLAIFTAGLAVLLYTRWGQYRPLRKCMGLSILVHLMLASYAATIQIITPVPVAAPEPVAISFEEKGDAVGAGSAAGLALKTNGDERPWETFAAKTDARPEGIELRRAKSDSPPPPQRLVRADSPELPGDPSLGEVAVGKEKIVVPSEAIGRAVGAASTESSVEPIEVPPPRRRDAAPAVPDGTVSLERPAGDAPTRPLRVSSEDVPAALLDRLTALPPPAAGEDFGAVDSAPAGGPEKTSPRPLRDVMGAGSGEDLAYNDKSFAAGGAGGGASARNSLVSSGSRGSGGTGIGLEGGARAGGDGADPKAVPNAYRLRVAPNRDDVAQSRGGTPETEAAAKAALKWLADNQDADGRWNPRTHGGGKEIKVLGRDRLGAGSQADSAVTGLALLALLASGNTHLDGPYSEDVRRGLEFLMRTQAADGNLGGQAAAFEFMYSHAMAACALSEAYGMTRDARLREPVRRAVAYTVAAQDPVGGGWRYRPGDAGDTSQLGWQLMTLKSAELAGIPVPEKTRQGIVRYLRSVSMGRHGGRASYRPGEQPSRPMTAEALVCWQFLGLSRQHPACNEAGDYLIEETPGEGDFNLYYWYYATLGMYQLQGTHWQRWNEAMRGEVVRRQVKEGPQAGSWNPDSVWGGYGGRVYTTAVAALCLEVYYRFLPLFSP